MSWNILTFLGVWVDDDWGLSFIVPGSIIAAGGFIVWLFLVPKPEDVNLSSDITVSQIICVGNCCTKVPVFYCLMKNSNHLIFYQKIFVVIFNKSRWVWSRLVKKSEKKGALFFPASGVIGEPWPYTLKFFWKNWRTFINWAYEKILLIKFFSKNLKFFFDFCEIQRGEPFGWKKIEKNFINKRFLYAQFMKVRQFF